MAEGDRNFVFMDAPPELEDSAPFVAIDRMLTAAGVRVPAIHAVDLSRGFMMLTDGIVCGTGRSDASTYPLHPEATSECGW